VVDISLSRRRLLAGASATTALGLFAGTSATQAKAPVLNAPAPAFYRFKLGTIEATVVSDGPLSIGDPKNTFRGPTAEELGKMMNDQFLPANNVVLDQNVLVINTGDKLALFETGMSSVKRNDDMGRLVANLKQSGIDPADVDAVIPTHAHIDHIGGIMAADGSRNFPNAQIYISQADLEFWTDDKRFGTPAEGSALAARKNLIPNRERIVFYKDGQEVLPGVQAMHTPGHTVGHTSFVVNSGGKSLFVVGDLMHHVILVERPRMEVGFDTDPKQGIETRIKVMDMLAAQRLPALVYHLPWPRHRSFRQAGRRLPLRGGADATGALVRPSPATRRGLRRVKFSPAARGTAASVLPVVTRVRVSVRSEGLRGLGPDLSRDGGSPLQPARGHCCARARRLSLPSKARNGPRVIASR
jgi:glyoxylase-like metal-dependent hydrolase (beta-lactamase superfamily II)